MTYPDEYLIGVQLFNRGDYFEAHEVWEDLWRATAGPDRAFYQGLIQVAVGLCHYYNGNSMGACRLYHRFRGYLNGFQPSFQGLDLDAFLGSLERLFEPALQAEPNETVWLDQSLVPPVTLEPAPQAWPAIPDL